MTGWNLPPGVNVNDIPGNRPEDDRDEEFLQRLDEKFIEEYGDKGKKWLEWQEHLEDGDLIWEYVIAARDLGALEAVHEYRADAEMAAFYEQEHMDQVNDRMREYDERADAEEA